VLFLQPLCNIISSVLSSVTYFHSFIHSDHFYSASSSPLVLKSVPDTARILCGVSCRSATGNCELRTSQGSYVMARAGVKPTALRLKAVDSTKAPPCPTNVVSSAYLKLFSVLPAIFTPSFASSISAFLNILSAYRLNKNGDKMQPCLTPFLILNLLVFPNSVLITADWSSYNQQ